MLEFCISNFDFSPTAQYIVVRALLHVFFVVLFLVNIIMIEKKVFISSSDKSDRKRNIGKFFLKNLFISSFTTSPARFSDYDVTNLILLEIHVYGRNIKETALARYSIKVTARPSFAQLGIIKRINRVY